MDNLETFDKKRSRELEWWRELKTENKTVLARLYFPNMDFFLVDTSSSRIQTIWERAFGI